MQFWARHSLSLGGVLKSLVTWLHTKVCTLCKLHFLGANMHPHWKGCQSQGPGSNFFFIWGCWQSTHKMGGGGGNRSSLPSGGAARQLTSKGKSPHQNYCFSSTLYTIFLGFISTPGSQGPEECKFTPLDIHFCTRESTFAPLKVVPIHV